MSRYIDADALGIGKANRANRYMGIKAGSKHIRTGCAL